VPTCVPVNIQQMTRLSVPPTQKLHAEHPHQISMLADQPFTVVSLNNMCAEYPCSTVLQSC